MVLDRRERAIVVVASTGHFLAHFAMGLYPAIVEPLRLELGLDFGAAAHVAFPGYLAFGLGAVPSGLLLRVLPARALLAGGNALIGLCAAGAALADEPSVLTLWLLGVGLGASVYHPVGSALVSTSVRARGRAIGLLGAVGNAGIAGAPLLGGFLAWAGSWRLAFWALGALGLGAAALTALSTFDEREVLPTSVHQHDLSGPARHRLRLFGILAAAMVLGGFVYRGAQILLPKHLGERLFGGIELGGPESNLLGTAVAAAVMVVAIAGQIAGGRLADRISLTRGYLLFHACSLPFLLGIALLPGGLVPLSAGMYAFFGLGMQPFENSLVARLVPARWRGLGFGLKFVLAFGVGSLAVDYVGRLADQSGTGGAYLGLAPFAAGIVLVALVLAVADRRGSRVPEPTS